MYEMVEDWNWQLFPDNQSQSKRVAKGLLLMKARGCKLDGLLEEDLKRGIIKVVPK
jgi:hypothetical protein